MCIVVLTSSFFPLSFVSHIPIFVTYTVVEICGKALDCIVRRLQSCDRSNAR